jgi:hypothetical protein
LLQTVDPARHDPAIPQLDKELKLFFDVTKENDYPQEKFEEMLMALSNVRKWATKYMDEEAKVVNERRLDSLTVVSGVTRINLLIDLDKFDEAYDMLRLIANNPFFSENMIPQVDKLTSFINEQRKEKAKKMEYEVLIKQANLQHQTVLSLRKMNWGFGGVGAAALTAGCIMVFAEPFEDDISDLQIAGIIVAGVGLSCLLPIVIGGIPSAMKASKEEKKLRKQAKAYLSISPMINTQNVGMQLSFRF